MSPEISQEEFARLFPRRFAEAKSLEAAWPSVGEHLRGALIEDFYVSLMAERRYTHEEAMGLARLAAGMQHSVDPRGILPIGPVNQALLEERGVQPRRQGPKVPPPRRVVPGTNTINSFARPAEQRVAAGGPDRFAGSRLARAFAISLTGSAGGLGALLGLGEQDGGEF